MGRGSAIASERAEKYDETIGLTNTEPAQPGQGMALCLLCLEYPWRAPGRQWQPWLFSGEHLGLYFFILGMPVQIICYQAVVLDVLGSPEQWGALGVVFQCNVGTLEHFWGDIYEHVPHWVSFAMSLVSLTIL